jgi:UDP:flavonoid glycosyltransferase YjiC (YdhE family)
MRLLFSCFPGYGHLHPLLPLARAARRAGHEVVFATGPGLAGRAAAFGFETWSVGLSEADIGARLNAEFVEVPGRSQSERLRALGPLLFVEIGARPRVGEMLALTADWRPDVIVHEYSELSAPIVGARLGIPTVRHGFGPLPPAELLEAGLDGVNALAWDHGVAELPADTLYLDPCPPSLVVPGSERPARSLPIGITASDPAPWEELPSGLAGLPYEETVYVTLGTVVNKREGALERLLGACAEVEANVVFTVGPDVDTLRFGRVPDNVLLERWIPQALLMPLCSAVVSHAGAGTMLGTLAFGLPSLLVPLGADQFFNAAAAEAAGAASVSALDSVDAAAIMRVVGDASLRAGAERVAAELAALPSPDSVLPSVLLETAGAGALG